jgi:hypothetical protein
MKYDDATWHSGGNFPADLPPEAGATHTGIFLAWALVSGLAGELHETELLEELEQLRRREVTPGAFFLSTCDGKFSDEDLSPEGNAFTREYFDFESGEYLTDYANVFSEDLPSLYHVPDSWESFERMRPVLDERLTEWRSSRRSGAPS